MSELVERARQLSSDLVAAWDTTENSHDPDYLAIIEQALLAERRLAMEEAAKMARLRADKFHELYKVNATNFWYSLTEEFADMERELRAAAEKEVGTK